VYSRELDGKTVDLGVSGKLWNGVLVMFDHDSESLWTQVDGRAIQGKYKGERLEHMNSEFTPWSTWVAAHPDTLVLQKTDEELGQSASHYADYFADPDALFFPELGEGLGGIAPKDMIYGLRVDEAALAIKASFLESEGLVTAVVAGTPVAIARDPETGFAVAFERKTPSGAVTFPAMIPGTSPTAELVDTATGKHFDPKQSPQVRYDRAFWYAFKKSLPNVAVMTD
jgi:hypothetical protein